MFGEALSLYRRHFAALLLTAALAVVPGTLLMGGALVFGLASLGSVNLTGEQPPREADQGTVRLRNAGSANAQDTMLDTRSLRALVPIAYAVFIAAGILIAVLSLAQAAMLPLVLDLCEGRACGPARAWAAVGSRFGACAWTALLAVVLVAVASLFLVVPGLVLAIGFAFAVPVSLLEGLSGRAALERSWSLARRTWARVIAVVACIAAVTALAVAGALSVPHGPWRLVVAGAVAALGYPVPLAALVLLYGRAVRGEGQYMRRISAPG